MVKNLLAKQETWISSLGCEDPLEKGMATHASILAWRIPWTEEPGGLHSPWDMHIHTLRPSEKAFYAILVRGLEQGEQLTTNIIGYAELDKVGA